MALGSVPDDQEEVKGGIRRRKATTLTSRAAKVIALQPSSVQRTVEIASEKGASSWLSALPVAEHGFDLSKAAFRDTVCLQYGWLVPNVPSTFACGSPFSVGNALQCPTGGFPILRHNEVRDLIADLMREVTHDVATEPVLQPLSGEVLSDYRSACSDPEARLDIATSGFFGGRFERSFFDIRVFNPHAPSNRGRLSAVYCRQDLEKRRKFGQRISEVEHASFVPVVLSCAGGAGPSASVVLKRLASLLSEKCELRYSVTLAWLRTCLCFALLRASIMCLRGSRSSRRVAAQTCIPPAISEGCLLR